MTLLVGGLGIGVLENLARLELGRFSAFGPSLERCLKPQLRPLPSGMVDRVHGQPVGTQAVGDDELGILHRQLERAACPSGATKLRKAGWMVGQAEDALDHPISDSRIDLIVVEPDGGEVLTGALVPENLHNAS